MTTAVDIVAAKLADVMPRQTTAARHRYKAERIVDELRQHNMLADNIPEIKRQEAARVWDELKACGLLAHPVSKINPYR